MPAGRPSSSAIDQLVALAQLRFLIMSFGIDDKEAGDWLRTVPVGAMNDRDVSRFLQSRSQLSPRKAAAIDAYLPGIERITNWPWRTLALSQSRKSGFQQAHHRFGQSLVMPEFKAPCVGTPFAERFVAVMSIDDWSHCESFFLSLIDYRIAEATDEVETTVRTYIALRRSFLKARLGSYFGGLASGVDALLTYLLPRRDLARQLIVLAGGTDD